MIIDECLPPGSYDIGVFPEAKFFHVRDLDLGEKSDKYILSFIIEMANSYPDSNFVFFTRDRGFEKDSGYADLKTVPINLRIIVLQKSSFVDNPDLRLKVNNGHRSELIQVVLALFANLTA